jgi:mediator of RNA polymerase II transcription subunit 14
MSQHANLKDLYTRRAAHALIPSKSTKAISLPTICAKLTDILPSKNRLLRTGKPWASDIIRLTFQGIELYPPALPQHVDAVAIQSQNINTQSSTQPSIAESAVLITEARIIVPFQKDLGIIVDRVDRDIAFHPDSGSFAFRLRSNIGESVIENLIERVARVERLVDFIQVLQKHKDTLRCVTVSLGKIVFTYKSAPLAQISGATEVDDTLEAYKAIIDFSAKEETIVILLEQGNPHLRIVDYLNLLINDQLLGLDAVATVLGLTISVHRGLDAIESAWAPAAISQKGDVFVNVRASDWYMIRYVLSQQPVEGAPQHERKVVFEVKLHHRKGVPWWLVRRTDNTREKESDELDQALKPVWSESIPGQRIGFGTSAVGQGKGVEDLLVKLDEAVRKYTMDEIATNQTAAGTQVPISVNAQTQRQLQRPGHQQQRQQQQTPNQSQNSNRSIKRDDVVIELE